MPSAMLSRARARVAACAPDRTSPVTPVLALPGSPADHRAPLALAVRDACRRHGIEPPWIVTDGTVRLASGAHARAWLVAADEGAVIVCGACGLHQVVGGGR